VSDGGFEIIETLDRDEDVLLYRARRRSDRRRVVLKVLAPEIPQSRELERLRNEVEVAGDLEQPGVLRPLMLATHDGVPALVSEDVSGVPLARLVGQPFVVGRFLELAAALAEGLDQIHRAGLVHKDLTPRNIIVDEVRREVRLQGFGLASRVPRQPPVSQPPELIEGTLPFMSPEQTGRMNRAVDNRSDLYSLGVVFFLMLTGKLPFTAKDPLGWVHAHVAWPVPSVRELSPEVPALLDAIVRRLLEKMPENRYQSARGLRQDLDRAAAAWRATGSIAPFALGERDVSDRLKLPQRLYGRETELAALQAVLDETVANGRPALALISGYAGVGKSGLVHELLRSIERARGIFLTGKFDAHQRDIPYSTFAQAFRRMLGDLVGAAEERKRFWRERLAQAVGTNGRLIAEIVPETELLLGRQPPLAPLPPIQSEERFRMVFHAFVTAFGTSEHPLVLFLDDLQWADPASLKLLRSLLTTPDTRHLLVFGAYRDNEVGAGHPLRATVAEIRKAGVPVPEMALGTLSIEDVVAFTADAVRCPVDEGRPLARLVHEKTAGNPFFVIQFFRELVRGGLLSFDVSVWRWRWELGRIRAQGYSDDVAQFIAERVAHLPPATREVLRFAACVGNSVDVRTLAAVTQMNEAAVERELLPAVEQGLLTMTSGEGRYQFAHDRVQQAAYALVPKEERPALHLAIGRVLLGGTAVDEVGDRLFEIVNQLIQGRRLIAADERIPFAELTLRAGLKAAAASANATAKTYYVAGLDSLPPDAWETHHKLAFALHVGAARATFFAGDQAAAQRQLRALHSRARSPEDEAMVATLEIYLLTVQGRLREAVEVMRSALLRYGLDLPVHPAREQVTRKHEAVRRAICDRTGDRTLGAISRLLELPRAEDPGIVALCDLLAILLLPALFTDENLLALLALTAVELSVHHGLTDATASAAVMVGAVLAGQFGRFDEADAFGRLGRAIVDVRGLTAWRAKVYLDYTLVNHWSHPLRTNVDLLRQALEWGLGTGNFAVACYAQNNLVTAALALGTPLADVQRQCEEALPFVRRAGYPMVDNILTSQLRLIMALRGLTADIATFDGDGFEEEAFLAGLDLNPEANTVAICWHSLRAMQAQFFAGRYEAAFAASLNARKLIWTSRAFMEMPEYRLFTALTLAALCDIRPPGDRPALIEALRAELAHFDLWTEACPVNFLHKRELIAAELSRVRGEELVALQHYERAIRAAHDAGVVQNEALAYELAAQHCRNARFPAVGGLYLAEALRCYRSWGADGKAAALERLHAPRETARSPHGIAYPATPQALDLMAVAKASQAISTDLSWEHVVRRLLEVALEHGGADRGCLLVNRDGALVLGAEASTDHGGVTTSLVDPARPATDDDLPIAAAQVASNARERVVLDDAAVSGGFAGDPYVVRRRPRSLLCLPIVSQSEVIAVLYLENKLVSGAFTPEHLIALEVVAAQAAIALANADLFAKLERENVERRRAEAHLEESRGKLQQIIDNSATLIFLKDLQGRYLLVNKAFEELFRLDREAIKGKTDEHLPVPRALADLFRSNDAAALRQARAIEFEEPVETDAGTHTFLSLKFPLHDATGRPYAVCGISTDITTRKRFEVQLRSSVSLLRATLDSTGDAIVVVDTGGRLVQFNQRFIDTWGLVNEHPFDLARLRDPAAFQGRLAALAHSPEEVTFDIVEFADGRIFESYSQPQRLDERVVGRVWSFRDVTVRVHAERERDRLLVDERRARTAAEQAVRVRDEFLSVASHELRTPLTSLQLAIQGLARRLPPQVPEPVSRNLELSRRQIRRLGGLVGLLLDVSRLQTGRLELDRHVVDLRTIVRDSATQLSEDFSRAGSPLTIHADRPVIGFWDASRMEQVSINLLTNAIKFGSQHPIEVTVEEDRGTARVEVADGGIGMPPEVQGRIFERYERGVSARHYAGLGLGLFIVRTIAEAHGGQVSVRSTLGHGSTFTVELPIWPTPLDRALEAAS
jgi:PAS domain S-box-containing protein